MLFPSVVGKQVVNIVSEISDQDRRCNLMVHNLPEPEQPSAQERTSADTKTVEGLIKDKLSVTDVKICKVLRLDKYKEKARRSLLVVFDDEKMKWTCLRRGRTSRLLRVHNLPQLMHWNQHYSYKSTTVHIP